MKHDDLDVEAIEKLAGRIDELLVAQEPDISTVIMALIYLLSKAITIRTPSTLAAYETADFVAASIKANLSETDQLRSGVELQ